MTIPVLRLSRIRGLPENDRNLRAGDMDIDSEITGSPPVYRAVRLTQ